MTNYLTGDYDAILQVSPRLLDGLLATLHQNAAHEDAPLKLPHSGVLRVGDPQDSIRVADTLGALGRWMRENKLVGRVGSGQTLREELASMAPPGARRVLKDKLSILERGQPSSPPPGIVRGTVKLQLSTPTIGLTAGSTFEVNIRADVRAHYYPDSGAIEMAAPRHPLHGNVDAVFELRTLSTATGRKLSIRPSAHDDKIRFMAAPGTGLTAEEVARVTATVRATVRERFTPLPVDLPSGFPFSTFKALGSGSSQAIALPIHLDGTPLSDDHIQSVTHSFIGSSGFAMAISKEYMRTALRTLIDGIKESIESFKRYVNRDLDVYYTARVTSGPSVSWSSGALTFAVDVKLVNHNAIFDFNLDIEQKLTLALNATTQLVSLKADGDPVVRGDIIAELIDLLGGGIRSSIKAARDEALPVVNEMLQATFAGAKARLVEGVRSFDETASVRFTGVEITAHGLIVRGELGSGPRHAPIVRVAETNEGRAFTALNSWIPGGRIERLTWSWVEHPGPRRATSGPASPSLSWTADIASSCRSLPASRSSATFVCASRAPRPTPTAAW